MYFITHDFHNMIYLITIRHTIHNCTYFNINYFILFNWSKRYTAVFNTDTVSAKLEPMTTLD